MNRRPLATFVQLSLLIGGCGLFGPTPREDQKNLAFTVSDEWHTKVAVAEKVERYRVGRKVPDSELYRLKDTAIRAGIRLLRERPWRELDELEVHRMTSASRSQHPSTTPYLVRGVKLNPGYFSVTWVGTTLWVEHRSMGVGPVAMSKQPIVVFLEAEPTELVVIPWMAQ